MISGIWENDYVQELGILDHCRELHTLKNKMTVLKVKLVIKSDKEEFEKNLFDLERMKRTYENEMVDLYLILQKRFQYKQELINKRIQRFVEKARGIKE